MQEGMKWKFSPVVAANKFSSLSIMPRLFFYKFRMWFMANTHFSYSTPRIWKFCYDCRKIFLAHFSLLPPYIVPVAVLEAEAKNLAPPLMGEFLMFVRIFPTSPPARIRNCNNKSKNHCLPTQKSAQHTKKTFFPIEKYTNSVNQENEREQQKKINRKKVLVYWIHSSIAVPERDEKKVFCVHSLVPIALQRVSFASKNE